MPNLESTEPADQETLESLRVENQRLEQEIAERRAFSKLLQRRLDFLNRIVQAMPLRLYVIDTADYTIKIANATAKAGRLVGGVTCHALTHGRAVPCSGEGQPCPLQTVVRTGEPTVVEQVHLDATDQPRDMEVHAFPIKDPDGKVVQMIEFCVDITARKNAEGQRDRLVAELRGVLDRF